MDRHIKLFSSTYFYVTIVVFLSNRNLPYDLSKTRETSWEIKLKHNQREYCDLVICFRQIRKWPAFSKNDEIMTNSVPFTHHLVRTSHHYATSFWGLTLQKLHTIRTNRPNVEIEEIFGNHIRVQISNDHSLIQLNNKKKSLDSSIWNFFGFVVLLSVTFEHQHIFSLMGTHFYWCLSFFLFSPSFTFISVVERELNVPLPLSKIIKKWNNLLQEYKVSTVDYVNETLCWFISYVSNGWKWCETNHPSIIIEHTITSNPLNQSWEPVRLP